MASIRLAYQEEFILYVIIKALLPFCIEEFIDLGFPVDVFFQV